MLSKRQAITSITRIMETVIVNLCGLSLIDAPEVVRKQFRDTYVMLTQHFVIEHQQLECIEIAIRYSFTAAKHKNYTIAIRTLADYNNRGKEEYHEMTIMECNFPNTALIYEIMSHMILHKLPV